MTYLKYTGNAIIPGIPARDLTKEEAGQYGEEMLINSGMWKRAVETEPATKKIKTTKDGE